MKRLDDILEAARFFGCPLLISDDVAAKLEDLDGESVLVLRSTHTPKSAQEGAAGFGAQLETLNSDVVFKHG